MDLYIFNIKINFDSVETKLPKWLDMQLVLDDFLQQNVIPMIYILVLSKYFDCFQPFFLK